MAKIKSPDSLNLKPPKFSNAEANKKAYNFRSKSVWYFAQVFNKKLATDGEADDFYTFLNNELKKSTLRNVSKVEPSKGGGGYYAHIMTVKVSERRKTGVQSLKI